MSTLYHKQLKSQVTNPEKDTSMFSDPLVRDQMFTSEEKECGWLLGFLLYQFKYSKKESVKDFYLNEFNKATQWKRRLLEEGKTVHQVEYHPDDKDVIRW